MITLSGVTAGYRGRPVVHDVSLAVRPGCVAALVGPNGSGKSTLIRAMTGLIPLMAGDVYLGETSIRGLKPAQLARSVAVVPQSPELPHGFTVGDAVMVGRTAHLRLWENHSRRDLERVREAMQQVGILDLAGSRVEELSGGEAQRVVVARALAQEAPILLLDEPTVHLDVARQAEMLEVVRALAREEGKTVLAVVHDLTLAAAYCDTIFVLSAGRLVASGGAAEALDAGLLSRVYGRPVRVIKDPESGRPVVLPPLPPTRPKEHELALSTGTSVAPPRPDLTPWPPLRKQRGGNLVLTHVALDFVGPIGAPDESATALAAARQRTLTKPPGSLGRLEELSLKLAGIYGWPLPAAPAKAIIVMAADHGVVQEGVSAYPAEVTAQMLANFLAGGAAINVLARAVNAKVVVVDMGVAGEPPADPALVRRAVRRGTSNMSQESAMTEDEAVAAIKSGYELASTEIDAGATLLGLGEMGIGNSTPAAAITAALLRLSPESVTGRGTGVDDDGLKHKISVVAQALEVNQPDPLDPLGVLSRVGGFEIAGLVGVVLAGATARVPVVVDGFISATAALVACRLFPAAGGFLIAGHLSVEPGHRLILEELGLEALLDLAMRLGEGTGAALAMHLVDAALALINEMATFESAGISGREG
ncbi:MAG: nicotinate-nucleotide--dimethylbenzimidazole phosphoribosyltransferase [Dehalococcoidia bacterium]